MCRHESVPNLSPETLDPFDGTAGQRQVSDFFAIARNSMSSIAIPRLRSLLMKLLHVTVETFWGAAVNRLDVSLFTTLDSTGVARRFKSSRSWSLLSLRILYPILSSSPPPHHATRIRTCWERTLSVSCLRLCTLCMRLPNIRRRVPRSVPRRGLLTTDATRK
jgi:hypothetical protein